MSKVILYYAHPGHQHSHANAVMQQRALAINDISNVDLYRDYPRFNIDINKEQGRLLEHDIIVFQFPVFWYSSPSIVKEWLDLVLEYGFAYGEGGDKLKGKTMLLALTTGGPEEAYSATGYQRHSLRTFFSPLQQTAALCQMHFFAPYVLFNALKNQDTERIKNHADGFAQLLKALKDESLDYQAVAEHSTINDQQLLQILGTQA